MLKVSLRNVTESDLPILFEQQADAESSAMAAVPSREREAFNAHWAKIMADEDTILRTIEVDGQVAGHLVSFLIEEEREVGYWLGREFWGKGIATKALAEFLKIIETRPLYAHVAKHNIGSRRVLEKCGFTVIGEDRYMNRAREEVEEFVLKLEINERQFP
jgi:RimJ/RimL family protein N-acetyltransferase